MQFSLVLLLQQAPFGSLHASARRQATNSIRSYLLNKDLNVFDGHQFHPFLFG